MVPQPEERCELRDAVTSPVEMFHWSRNVIGYVNVEFVQLNCFLSGCGFLLCALVL